MKKSPPIPNVFLTAREASFIARIAEALVTIDPRATTAKRLAEKMRKIRWLP